MKMFFFVRTIKLFVKLEMGNIVMILKPEVHVFSNNTQNTVS